MNKVLKVALLGIADIVVFFALWWAFLFPLNVQSASMWVVILILTVASAGVSFMIEEGYDSDKFPPITKGLLVIAFIGCVLFLLFGAFGLNMFSSKKKANVMPEINEGSIEEVLSGITIDNLQIADTDSAKQYGARTLGSCSDTNVLSQNMISDAYASIVVNGEPLKVAPLEYSGLFKAFSGKGVYGYVKVSPVAENISATYVKTEPFCYTPDAVFGKYLKRNLRFQYPSLFMKNTHLELTDDNEMMWVTTYYHHSYSFTVDVVDGVIVTDPYTGKSTRYELDEIPEWVDIVYDGEYVSEVYDWFGRLSNGWVNSWTSQVGCTVTTDDFGYLAIGNDMFMYTGITSVTNGDESNIGFLIVNLRTFEAKMFKIPSTEEYSAMGAAEQEVSNYGYTASFPSLLQVEGLPTYVMVLKDENGWVKRYAMVNIEQCDVVAVGSTLQEAQDRYLYLMGLSSSPETVTQDQQPGDSGDSGSSSTETTMKLGAVTIDGVTYLCVEEILVTDENGNVTSMDLSDTTEVTIQIK